MTPRRGPRMASDAIRAVRRETTPATLLAAVQAIWQSAVGPGIAARAEPVRERDGVVTVACESATWAQELDLMQSEIVSRLNRALAATEAARDDPVRGLRATADMDRFRS